RDGAALEPLLDALGRAHAGLEAPRHEAGALPVLAARVAVPVRGAEALRVVVLVVVRVVETGILVAALVRLRHALDDVGADRLLRGRDLGRVARVLDRRANAADRAVLAAGAAGRGRLGERRRGGEGDEEEGKEG